MHAWLAQTAIKIAMLAAQLCDSESLVETAKTLSAAEIRNLAKARTALLRVLVSAVGGTPNINITGIDISFDGGTRWATHTTFGSAIAITAVGEHVREIAIPINFTEAEAVAAGGSTPLAKIRLQCAVTTLSGADTVTLTAELRVN